METKYFVIVFVAVLCHFAAGSPEPKCLATGVAFYRDASNCSRYYECNRGKLITLYCGEDMYYNDEIRACDFPEYVDCDPVCPYPSDGVNLYYDPKNCSRYYECDRGQRILMECPPEVPYWNHIEQYCDFAEYVDCSRGGSTTVAPITIIPSTKSPSSAAPTVTSIPTSIITSPSPTATSPSTISTSTPTSIATSPSTISTSTPTSTATSPLTISTSTPTSTATSPLTISTSTPTSTATSPLTISTSTPTSTATSPLTISTSTPTSTATSPSSTPTDLTTIDPTDCPSSGTASLVYPPDCARYYFCKDGKKTVEKCPEGLLFNDVTLRCDFYNEVTCDKASTHVPYPSTTASSPTQSSPAPTATSPSSAPSDLTTIDPTGCPSSGTASLVYPPDCARYYFCRNGKKTVEKCPEGLLFNDVTLRCDFYNEVNCEHATTHSPFSTASE